MRCREDLPPGRTMFCPACGAPQLRVSEDEIEAAAAALAGLNAPRSPDVRLIQWPAAVSVSLICGVAAGVLCSMLVGGLQFLLVLWAAGGAIAGVTLYSRRFPRAWIGGGVGARIGLLCGLFSASVSTLLSSLVLVAQRFLFGQGQQIDTALDGMVKQLAAVSAQVTPQGQPNPYLALVNGPEGHAVLLITTMIGTFFFTMFFSLIGGAAGGHYFAVRRRVQSPAA
jgi:hypothetical protein